LDNEKVLKSGGKGLGEGQLEKNENVTNAIPKLIYVASFIQIGQWESV